MEEQRWFVRVLAMGAFVGASTLVSGCSLINSFDDFDFDDLDGAVLASDASGLGDAGSPDGDTGGPLACGENQRVRDRECTDCPASSSRPAGDPADGPDTVCSCNPGTIPIGTNRCEAIVCEMGLRVEDHTCVACPANSTNNSGDDASSVDTACTCDAGFGGDGKTSCVFGACNTDFRVMAGACVTCPPNSSNEGGDLLASGDSVCDCDPGTIGDGITSCEVISCPAMQRVEGNECVACPAMSTNAAGDDASLGDTDCECIPGTIGDGRTSCDVVLCGLNQRVQNHLCVPCPERSINAAGNSALGGDTTCDCIADTEGPTCEPICGDGIEIMGETCDDGNTVTESSCPYGQPSCMVCNESCTALVPRSGAFCGDGTRQMPQERCDDGTNVGALMGACVACRGIVVQQLTIRNSSTGSSDGSFGTGNAVDFADGLCAHLGDYQAMFADGVSRRASSSPFVGDGQLDWVLRPFTAYYNVSGAHVWTTDDSALLGVRNGAPAPLLASITASPHAVWTGMRANHITAAPACNGWTTDLASDTAPIGNSGHLDGRFLEIITNTCDLIRGVYCVEQPL